MWIVIGISHENSILLEFQLHETSIGFVVQVLKLFWVGATNAYPKQLEHLNYRIWKQPIVIRSCHPCVLVALYFTHALYFCCHVVAGLDDVDMERTSIDTELQGDIRFSVWVSFAEIYNEQIFALLEPISKSALTKRKTMQLREDRHGNPYIKGLLQLLLSSAIEGSFSLRWFYCTTVLFQVLVYSH